MTSAWDDPANCPVRFNAPDGWRTPHPQWVSLYQGYEPPPLWQPYPDCPPAPPHWPFWEENGAAWFAFFHRFQPPPTRAIGWWFSLVALAMFSLLVIPFALAWPASLAGGIATLGLLITGVTGLIRHFRRQASIDRGDPMDFIRSWAQARRDEWFRARYAASRSQQAATESVEEFSERMRASWWAESDASAESS